MKPYLITAGEPAGIGPDCIIRAYTNYPDRMQNSIIVAPAIWMQQRAAKIGFDIRFSEFATLEAAAASPVINGEMRCWNPVAAQPQADVTAGIPSPLTAAAVIHCIESAALACLHGSAAALVTGPIEKAVLKSQGFAFPGHTEFLAALARKDGAKADNSTDFVMMLASDQLRVALLTTHLAISEVPSALSIQESIDCIRIVHNDLQQRFRIAAPRLGLCGLNPHAGEQGHFGSEEIDILQPAVTASLNSGIDVIGPLPADTLFAAGNRKNFDAIICCYHDQALIPIKALSFGDAVNVTLGLPFVRTSVDHGTALDRVGKPSVSSSSLLAALSMAEAMTTG